MDKNQWMNSLYAQLSGLPENERRDIMMDYEEHFAMAKEQGRTEQEIIATLGDPRSLAKQYNVNYKIDMAQNQASTKNLFSAVMAGAALGFFNLVFILGPFIGLVGVLVGLYGGAFGVTVAGIAVTVSPLIQPLFPGLIHMGANTAILTSSIGSVLLVSVGIGLTCLGILFFMGDIWLSKVFYRLTVKYLKWNADIITRRGK